MRSTPRPVRFALLVLAVLTAAFAASTVVAPLRVSAEFWDLWVYNAVFVLAAGACAARAALVKQERMAWAALAVGMGCSSAGELVLALRPDAWVYEAFFLAYYPLAYVAIALLVRSRLRGAGAGVWLDGLVCGLALAAVAATLAFDAIADGTGGHGVALLAELAYPVGDLLLMLLVAGAFGLAGGRPGASWALLGAGLLAWAAADTAYLFTTASETYREGTPIDTGWAAGCALIAIAAWWRPTRVKVSAGDWASLALPALATTAAVVTLLVCALGSAHPLGAILAAAALAAAVGRTGLTFRDVRRLAESRRLAHTDELTGLANRRALFARLEAADASDEAIALIVFDLDDFKELNDTLGHHAGDEVLIQVGARAEGLLRGDDVLARLGGDEFAIVLGNAIGGEEALRVAQRLRRRLEHPFDLDGVEVSTGGSFGVALRPVHAGGANSLLRRADAAMYAAKAAGTGAELYSSGHDPTRRDRLRTVSDLRAGITRGELEIYLQPQVALEDRSLVGAEVLVRWHHPEFGLLSPGAFLPALAQTNVLQQLTGFVLESALAAAADRPGLRISVNITAPDILDHGFPARVGALIEASGVPASQLCLEITEGSVMSDTARAIAALERLRALGVRLSLDDFGTGHSSLARLLALPVDELKIDRSFVMGIEADERNLAVIRSTVTLGGELGLSVVAEGIETEAALERVAEAGCDLAQGFLLAKPLPPAKFDAWARRHAGALQASTSR